MDAIMEAFFYILGCHGTRLVSFSPVPFVTNTQLARALELRIAVSMVVC